MQLTNKQKQDIISRIRTSAAFKKASTSNALLQYLHDATLKGVDLNENVIDIDFFGRKEHLEKNNTKVRVSVYNLRKKLADYYNEEGIEDTWLVQIEKGQYQLLFTPKNTQTSFKTLNWKILLPYAALALCLSLLIITNIPPSTPKLWRRFMTEKQPTKVYVGDLFGMTGTTSTGYNGWTRDYRINNFTDFYSFIEQHPELQGQLKPAVFNITPGMTIISAQRLQQFFQEQNRELNINFLTRTSTNEITADNAIYIGAINSSNKFIRFFNKANKHYQIKNRKLIVSKDSTSKDTIIDFNESNEKQEYAVISKYRATDNTEHFVFFSQNEIGVLATVEYFTNTDSIKSFTKKYLKGHQHFTAVFKVEGQDRTNTDLSIESVVTF